jgi:hypothetical protein
MKKLTHLLGFAVALAALGGCELYLGESKGDNWSYCGSDGFYTCDGDNCNWTSATCPSGGNPQGTDCQSNEDCAAGCFCGTGNTCEEAGFCKDDADCAEGLHCDDRSSCVPDACSAATACEDPTDACDGGNCVAMSCALPDTGTCVGGNSTNPPACGVGTVPLTFKGCFAANGACQSIALCDVAAACSAIQHESDCNSLIERDRDAAGNPDLGPCAPVYQGNNCTSPNGQACTTPGANCTCESFTYRFCEGALAQ